MVYINIYRGERDLKDNGASVLINGAWTQSRPLGFSSVTHTIRCLWLVLSGKADIVVWEHPQNNHRF